MKTKIFKTLIISAAVCAVMTVSSYAASMGGGVVTASALNLRTQPNTTSDIVTTAPRGSSVIIAEEVNGWYRVWYDGYSGYMSGEYLDFYEDFTANFGKASIGADQVRLRSQPNTTCEILETCDIDTEVKITGISGSWLKVTCGDKTGYVSSDYIHLPTHTPGTGAATVMGTTPPEAMTEGQKIVNTAMKYLGTPYVWAGTSPSGFDCSGLVYYVYKECGYSTNRTAASLYTNGSYVDKSQLEVGDIICFTNSGYSYIGHVGIYIGDGQFIHASSSNGEVIITELSTNYYTNHYYGARRIV